MICIIIFSFLFIFINNKQYFSLTFQNYFDESNENIMKSLFFSNIHYNLTIGTPKQNIPILIKFNYYYFSINSKKSEKTYLFNEDSSTTYVQLSNISKGESDEFSKGFKSEDKFLIENHDYRLNFFCSETNANHNIFGGTLGFSLQGYSSKEKDFNFIENMKNKKYIDDYSVTISYTNKNEGKLLIGSYLYKINKKYKESDFKSDITSSGYWSWNVKSVLVGEKLNLYTKYLIHYPELGIIVGNRDYYDYINKFFENYSNCQKEIIEIEDNEIKIYSNLFEDKNNFYYFKCSKDFQINKLESIMFDMNILETKFILDYNDLFYENENSYYFLVIFPKNIEENYDEDYNNIILGSPFYKKYSVTFDMNRKLIGIYKNSLHKKKDTNYLTFFIILILICIIVFLLYYAFYVKKISLKKYGFKNIFIEDFEYKTSDYTGLK